MQQEQKHTGTEAHRARPETTAYFFLSFSFLVCWEPACWPWDCNSWAAAFFFWKLLSSSSSSFFLSSTFFFSSWWVRFRWSNFSWSCPGGGNGWKRERNIGFVKVRKFCRETRSQALKERPLPPQGPKPRIYSPESGTKQSEIYVALQKQASKSE